MRARIGPSEELRELAAAQAGVLTRWQAEQLGLGRHSQQRLVGQRQWQRLADGLLLVHDQEPDWMAWAWGGVLKGGAFARLAGLAAAHLDGLVEDPPHRIDVLHPHGTLRRDMSRWRFRQERDGVRRRRSVGSPPRTRVEDTVLDLCSTGLGAADRHSPHHWVSRAIQQRLTTHLRLAEALQARPDLTGRSEVAELLEDVGQGAQSVLELRYLRDVERAHGLPAGTRQAPAAVRGRRQWRDVRYETFGLLVELDGRTGHSGTDRFRDFQRDNAALLAGEVTLRYGWDDVRHRCCPVAFQVAEVLIRGGWEGLPIRCPHCPPDGADAVWP